MVTELFQAYNKAKNLIPTLGKPPGLYISLERLGLCEYRSRYGTRSIQHCITRLKNAKVKIC